MAGGARDDKTGERDTAAPRTKTVLPNRAVSRSPSKRPVAIPREKPATATAATVGLPSSDSVT
jgi:hypothetical protein